MRMILRVFLTFAKNGYITTITGLPPATLNTLEKLADALGDNPDFFNWVQAQLLLKRNISDSYDINYINSLIASYYTKTQTDSLLNNKLNSSEITKYYTITQTSNLYVDKTTWSNSVATLTTSVNSKANSSDLLTYYYTKTTTNSILDTYYNKTAIDNTFSQYYNRIKVDTILNN